MATAARGSYSVRTGLATLAAAGALVLAACGQVQTAQRVENANLVEGIVYTTLRPPNLDIYLFDGRGHSPRPLTLDAALDYNAVFSPDGRWVVFTSERAGNADLYALDLEEEKPPVPITRHEALDDAASFSPNGERLAFVSTRDGDADIFVMPFAPDDRTAESRAVNLTRRPGGDFQPAFSPDGGRIAYSRQGNRWSSLSSERPVFDISVVDLYVMDADGSNARQVSRRTEGLEMGPGTAYGSVAGSPVWADEELLYYYSVTAAGREIRRMRADGSEDARIVSEGLSPALAPGGRIAFSRPQPREGMDAGDLLRTGRIFSVTTQGAEIREESDEARAYFAPHFDLGSGRMVAHGTAMTEGHVGDLGDGYLFAPPGARGVVRLPDRVLAVHGVHGFFPALSPEGDVISTILELAGEPFPLTRCAPDGSELATIFESESGIPWGVAVAREAGWLVVAIGPLFAPGEADVDVWRMGLDGADATNLTAELPGNHALPHVSADGGRIVFRTGGDGGGQVYAMGPDGAGRRRLTAEDAIETMPALTSDGEWVVFSTDRAIGRKLWIQRVDGTEGRWLEPDRLEIPDTSMHARFSPDGAWVVFTSDRGGYNDEWPLTPWPQPYGDLWAVPVAGGPAVRLTHNKWEDGPGDWGDLRVAR
jgi:Tol biopolymer transport system component